AEQARPAERIGKKRLHIFAQYRHQNEDCPKSVDNAGDGGQKFGGKGKNSAQPDWTHLGNEDGYADRQRHGDDQRKQRRYDRAVDEWQRAVLVRHRIPVRLPKELPAKSVPRECGAHHQLINDQAQQRHHGQAAKAHRPAKSSVGDFADLPLQQRRRSGFDLQGGLRPPLRFGSVETRPGQGLIGHSTLRLSKGCYKLVKKWERLWPKCASPQSFDNRLACLASGGPGPSCSIAKRIKGESSSRATFACFFASDMHGPRSVRNLDNLSLGTITIPASKRPSLKAAVR